ncbi:23S rRNA (guanine(2445)-N(2))/(guanine(2069)-N(7))-methyltransferase [Bermanella sp. 47_1433_sub80_T6]|nr:23S rRNA (guanine(2445)-N(2))/(guanine(2069)-N(7))-methyltransferase [Bermanella sp. 47_1433_sub80_T6]
MTITCPKGLEQLLADEITELGAQQVKLGVSYVSCKPDQLVGYKICLWSRLASRVLWPLAKFPVENAENMYEQLMQIPWIEHFSDRQTFRVHFNGSNDEIRNTHFGALKVKDAICDYFREVSGNRPDVSDKPDVGIHIRLYRDEVSVSLDFAGESLHRRGYRQSQGMAPLKENLAAALLIRAGWPELMKKPDAALLDPMCGSGTLLIEAALMAADIAPGLLRNQFAFEKLKNHLSPEWQEIRAQAQQRKEQAQQGDLELTLAGYDMDREVIAKAKDNARRAGVMHFIHVKTQPLSELTKEKGLPDTGLILCNPPYGERLSDEVAIGSLYAAMGHKIKQHFANWTVAIFTGNPQQAYQFKMRSDKQYQLYNGAIASKLFIYKVSAVSSEKVQQQVQSQTEVIKLNDGAQMVCNRLQKNLRKLKPWAKKQGINCYRLYDADMPEYSVAIDIYDDWVHIQEYAPPKTVDPEKAQNRLREVLDAVPVALKMDREKVVLKQRMMQKGRKQYEKQDQQQQMFAVQEGTCRFYVNLKDYLDTGLFLDHRPIRTDIETLAKDKDFLNLFSYTCTASVHAAMGGARSTVSVDMSTTYLNWGRKNLTLNGLPEKNHEFIQADCLQWLKGAQKSSQRFDIIFMDPPSFSNSKRMDGVLDVQRDHVDLIKQCMSLLRPGGQLIFSTNYRRFKMERDALNEFAIEDISAKSLPKDFARNSKIHQCYIIDKA